MSVCEVPGCTSKRYAHGICNRHYLLARKHPEETLAQLALRNRGARREEEVRAAIRERSIVTDTGCWEWSGSKIIHGYGALRWNGKHWRVHRLAYTLFVGPIPDGAEVCHRCDNPPCCNPDHLFLGSHVANMLDASTKGRLSGNGDRIGEANGNSRLTVADVRAIRASGMTQVALAQKYGVSQPTISAIRLRKIWRSVD
jgi:hypothetical protein